MNPDVRIRLYASLTAMITELVKGSITLQELNNSTSRLVFGCDRGHIFPDSGVPAAVTWASRGDYKPIMEQEYISEGRVEPRALELFRGLQGVILEQEKVGHVRYGYDNLPAMRDGSKVANIHFWYVKHFPAPGEGYDPSLDPDIQDLDSLRRNPDVNWAVTLSPEEIAADEAEQRAWAQMARRARTARMIEDDEL